MQMTVSRGELKEAVAGFNKIVNGKTTLPILSCVKFENNGHGILAQVTDLDQTASYHFIGAQAQGEGSFIVPLAGLKEMNFDLGLLGFDEEDLALTRGARVLGKTEERVQRHARLGPHAPALGVHVQQPGRRSIDHTVATSYKHDDVRRGSDHRDGILDLDQFDRRERLADLLARQRSLVDHRHYGHVRH